jgi:hypothetical protein
MSSVITKAKKCFADNFDRYANPTTHPEQFNLYKGLHALAEALEAIESELSSVSTRLARLEEKTR